MPEKPKTPAFRPVNPQVQSALGELPSGPFNFGLYFHKWFYVVDGNTFPSDGWKRSSPWACTLADETKVAENVNFCRPNFLLDNFEVSLALFNGKKDYPRPQPSEERGRYKEKLASQSLKSSWDRKQAARFLEQKHRALESVAQCLEKLGYKYHKLEFHLQTPLILGLGDEHPTEKGFRFDWNLGIPFIPASSLKGVVRLAWLVDFLKQLGPEEAEAFALKLTNDKLEEADRLPPGAVSLFGCGGDKSQRGRVIFLDAYPKTLPRLKPEIMTCHYRDYYEGRRGPTENQQPNPQKFWAVHPFEDEAQKQPLTFVFRLLLALELARDAALKDSLLKAFQAALAEHGLGAKTAIGHGRFQEGKPSTPGIPAGEKEKRETAGPQPVAEVWERAKLSWEPGSATLTASSRQGKAYLQGKDAVREILPPELFGKVVEKRKTAEARVTVANFQILKVETP